MTERKAADHGNNRQTMGRFYIKVSLYFSSRLKQRIYLSIIIYSLALFLWKLITEVLIYQGFKLVRIFDMKWSQAEYQNSCIHLQKHRYIHALLPFLLPFISRDK